ncbi:MAG: hypothetical protein EPO36_07485 [Chloroflexota bacterium]|nr:MAG: hypothetical protein EPO36_07485 [Chloroflexota bacterium]
MPPVRALVIAVGVGGGVAAYTLLWWHWPLPLGIGAAILLGGLSLTGFVSVRREGAAADAAWRSAAPDLQEVPAVPLPDVPVRRPIASPASPASPAGPAGPAASQDHDLPSGD